MVVYYEIAIGLGETPKSQHSLISHIPAVEVEQIDLLLEVSTPEISSHSLPVSFCDC